MRGNGVDHGTSGTARFQALLAKIPDSDAEMVARIDEFLRTKPRYDFQLESFARDAERILRRRAQGFEI